MGLPRHVEEPVTHLVLHGKLWQPQQDARLPRSTAADRHRGRVTVAEASVRAARADDAAAIAALQVRTWQVACADILPAPALQQIDEASVAAQWRASTVSPPSPQHRILVALDGPVVVGVAATAPAGELDSEALLEGELVTLLVDADHGRRGHGSRLLAAAVDQLQGDGFRRAQTWVLDGDDALVDFLTGAGWAADGNRRELDMGRPVEQRRFHTDISDGEGA
jgi:GNAT superfamily N-acetyltransferase